MSRQLITVLAAVALVLVLPDLAAACPVCFDPRAENREAFLATTAVLSLLPLGMVGGLGMWLRRRSDELDDSRPDGEADG